jgi:hypothetical protein
MAPLSADDDRRQQLRNEMELIIRIDERTQVIAQQVKEIKEVELKAIRDVMVSRVEFQPVKLLVYGLVALILSSVFAAVLALVLTAK